MFDNQMASNSYLKVIFLVYKVYDHCIHALSPFYVYGAFRPHNSVKPKRPPCNHLKTNIIVGDDTTDPEKGGISS